MESFRLLHQKWKDRGASVCCCRIKIAAFMEGSSHNRYNNSCCLLHNKWVLRRNCEKLQLIMVDELAIGFPPNDLHTALCYWNLFHASFGFCFCPLIHLHDAAERPDQSSRALPADEAQLKDVEYAELEPRDMYAAQLLCELKSQPGLHEKDHEIDDFLPKSGKLAHDYSPQSTAPRRIVRKVKDILSSGEKDEKNQVSLYRKSGSSCGRIKLLPASIEVADRLQPDFPSKLTDGGMKSSNGSIWRPIIEKYMNTTRNCLKKRKRDIPSSATSFGALNVSVNWSKRPRKYKTLTELYK